LNETQQFLVYTDEVNLLGKNINTMKKNTTIIGHQLGGSSRRKCQENSIYVLVLSTKYRTETQIRIMRNTSSETVAKCRYLEAMLKNQNCIYEEITSRLYLRNACYNSLKNLDFPYAICKERYVESCNLHSILYECDAWPLALREEHRLKVLCCKEYLDLRGRK
jgi:hypothetical protein